MREQPGLVHRPLEWRWKAEGRRRSGGGGVSGCGGRVRLLPGTLVGPKGRLRRGEVKSSGYVIMGSSGQRLLSGRRGKGGGSGS